MLQLVLTIYGAVFVAEIVGDKLLYTTGVLAARYRSASVVLVFGVVTQLIAAGMFDVLRRLLAEAAAASQAVESAAVFG